MNEEKSRVDALNEKLYSKTRYKEPTDAHHGVSAAEAPDVEEKWQTPELDQMLMHERTVSAPNPFMKKFFVFAVVFFLVTIGVAGYIILGGANFVSSRNVDIGILGPSSVAAGEVLELGVTVTNANNADLEAVSLSIQYPPGTRDPEDTGRTLTYGKEDIGSIRSGGEAVRDVSLVLIGSAGEVREIKFTVEYKVRGSNATFYKDKIYEVTIGSAPVSLTVERPINITSGEPFSTLVSVTLHSTEILRGVMLKAEYPYGYFISDSSPQAVADNSIWSLGDLSPGDKKTVSIRGHLIGENMEERTFRFYVGVSESGSTAGAFNNTIVSSQETIAISRPSLAMNISLNGDTSQTYVAPAGQSVTTSVRLQNNMTERLLNPRLEVRFSGEALNRLSVNAQNNGFYNSQTNVINWELGSSSGQPELLPGAATQVYFSFASLADLFSQGGREIGLELVLTGVPQGSLLGQPITVRESRTVRIASQVSLSARTARAQGPFNNTGPIPPRVGVETTYSVILTAGNTQNDVSNARVTASLGPGVEWVGASSAASEDVSYNPNNNTVTWNLGTLASGAGFSSASRTAAFQVSLTPSTSQIGIAPTLVTGLVFNGSDTFTNESVRVNHQPLTTAFTTDPSFVQGDDRVQP